jgi:hypothetical protein
MLADLRRGGFAYEAGVDIATERDGLLKWTSPDSMFSAVLQGNAQISEMLSFPDLFGKFYGRSAPQKPSGGSLAPGIGVKTVNTLFSKTRQNSD